MGTSLVYFSTKDTHTPRWGVQKGNHVHVLSLDAPHHADVMSIYFNARSDFDAAISPDGIDAGTVTWHSPVSRPVQLIAQGLNYADHRDEAGLSANAAGRRKPYFHESKCESLRSKRYDLAPCKL